jgi:hypothetical protein
LFPARYILSANLTSEPAYDETMRTNILIAWHMMMLRLIRQLVDPPSGGLGFIPFDFFNFFRPCILSDLSGRKALWQLLVLLIFRFLIKLMLFSGKYLPSVNNCEPPDFSGCSSKKVQNKNLLLFLCFRKSKPL